MIMSTSDETMPKSRAHAMAKSRERRVVAALGRMIETDAKQKFMRPVPLVAVPVGCEQPQENIQKPSVC